MACILDGGKLTLSGTVGDDWWGDAFTYSDVLLALAAVEENAALTVHINSGGGTATEGAAIYSLLANRVGQTDVVIEGIAASAASLIAMAGKTVRMAEGSIAMIHDPSGFTVGTSADHAKQIESLEALATAYARVYAAKSGKTPEECREIMKAERWFTPDEAIEEGFADEAMGRPAAAVAMFDYGKYSHAPRELRAQAKRWIKDHPKAAMSAAPTRQSQEADMTDKTTADTKPADNPALMAAEAVRADRTRRAAIMALDEAKGREALAEHLYTATDWTVDEVKSALMTAPDAVAPAMSSAMPTTGLSGRPADARPQMRVDLTAMAKRRAGVA